MTSRTKFAAAWLGLAVALAGGSAGAQAGQGVGAGGVVCVANATDSRLYFTAEADGGAREASWLSPHESLCASGGATGTVAAFESPDAIEGCSWLVRAGEVRTLLRYADFDRCAWGQGVK